MYCVVCPVDGTTVQRSGANREKRSVSTLRSTDAGGRPDWSQLLHTGSRSASWSTWQTNADGVARTPAPRESLAASPSACRGTCAAIDAVPGLAERRRLSEAVRRPVPPSSPDVTDLAGLQLTPGGAAPTTEGAGLAPCESRPRSGPNGKGGTLRAGGSEEHGRNRGSLAEATARHGWACSPEDDIQADPGDGVGRRPIPAGRVARRRTWPQDVRMDARRGEIRPERVALQGQGDEIRRPTRSPG